MCIGEEGHTPNPRLLSFLRMLASSPEEMCHGPTRAPVDAIGARCSGAEGAMRDAP
jgi:hypothetical protein